MITLTITHIQQKLLIVSIALICFTTSVTGKEKISKIISRQDGSITFVVDENLSPAEKKDRNTSGDKIAQLMRAEEQLESERFEIITSSFANDNNLRYLGEDAFFQCMVRAYAEHRSIVISPDMVWLIISQGFARYVNEHAEELRPLLVNHKGKMDLVIESGQDLLSDETDWQKLIGDFTSQIDKHTKKDIAKTITSDFSTTTLTERIASQITLMESVKSYFEYIVFRIACGIPSITLKGTPKDWQLILEKTRSLSQYGLSEWTKELEPILGEFVQATKGKPNQEFWQSIVKKKRIDQLSGGWCSPNKPTELDGWILKLFPDKNGVTLGNISHTKHAPSEWVRVGFKYLQLSPTDGTVISETPMELWAGFIGVEDDALNNTLTPKIGWMVGVAKDMDSEEMLNKLKKMNDGFGIRLRVKEVPEILSRLPHIKLLHLEFTDTVVLPDWLENIQIDDLLISGNMTEQEKEEIKKRFPMARFK